MGRSWLLEVVVRLFILLINKSVLLIMTTKTKTQGTEGGQKKKKLQSPDFPFSFERLPRVQIMEMAKWESGKRLVGWVDSLSISSVFLRNSNLTASLFLLQLLALEAARDPLHMWPAVTYPVCRISVSICSAVFFQSFQICVGNFAFTVVLLLLGSKGN